MKRRCADMNFGMETELVEFKKSTGELKEGMISLTLMLKTTNYSDDYHRIV